MTSGDVPGGDAGDPRAEGLRAIGSAAVAPHPGAVGKRVLLVEDDATARYLFGHLLRLGGYAVLEAADGLRAVDMARMVKPELLVLDLGLPLLDGWQVLLLLRRRPETRAIPVLVVTVHGSAPDQDRAAALGARGYFVKPTSPLALLRAVDAMLGVEREPHHPDHPASSGGSSRER